MYRSVVQPPARVRDFWQHWWRWCIFVANASGTVIEGNASVLEPTVPMPWEQCRRSYFGHLNASNTRIGGTTSASAKSLLATDRSVCVVWSNASGDQHPTQSDLWKRRLGYRSGNNGTTVNDGALTAGQGNLLMDSRSSPLPTSSAIISI